MSGVEIRLPRSLTGIYHLLRGDTVVYVGQTANVFARISKHKVQFDRVMFYPCELDELDAREQADIERLRPGGNSEGVRRPYRVRSWLRGRVA